VFVFIRVFGDGLFTTSSPLLSKIVLVRFYFLAYETIVKCFIGIMVEVHRYPLHDYSK